MDTMAHWSEEGLGVLVARSTALKRDLVEFACSPRMKRSLGAAMLKAGIEEFEEADAIGIIDRFALQYRLPDDKTVVDRFVASRPDLDAADREMLLGWRDPVEGIFEIRSRDGDAIILLNLIDDLEYRTYSNMGRAVFQRLPRDGFLYARLVPIRPVPGVWLLSGMMSPYPKSGAAQIARAVMQAATRQPELVFRNPEKIEQGWEQMREDRAAFVEFFGGDDLVLPPAEAEERLNAYYRHQQEAALARQPGQRRPPNLPGLDVPVFEFPPALASADTATAAPNTPPHRSHSAGCPGSRRNAKIPAISPSTAPRNPAVRRRRTAKPRNAAPRSTGASRTCWTSGASSTSGPPLPPDRNPAATATATSSPSAAAPL